MVKIEAKILEVRGTYSIICPINSTNCAALIDLICAFRGFMVISSRCPDDGYPILLLIHEPKEMQKDQKRLNLLGQDLFINPSELPKPEIHFLQQESRVEQCLVSLYLKKKLDRELRREYEVMDNNIWNFLVPIVAPKIPEANKIPTKESLLRTALEVIHHNYERGLYQLDVACEYADWSARLFRQSFLNGSHALDVSPHVFHSESVIRLLRNKEIPDNLLLKFKGDNVKWRFLLVDDHAMKKLKTFYQEKVTIGTGTPPKLLKNFNNVSVTMSVPSQESSEGKVSKCDIIKDLLEKLGFNVFCRQWNKINVSDADIMIEYAENLDDARKALSKENGKEYDIILLDYLLDENDKENLRNYGYELLEDIKNNSKEYRIGPSKQLFFICMSAFSSAVQGRLFAQGLSQSESYWYIDTGACPTNTPQLFTYSLLQLMEKRLDDSGIWGLTNEGILELIIKIFGFKKVPYNDINKAVRTRARDNYHEVLRLLYNFRKILQDVEVPEDYDEQHPERIFKTRGSVLASYFMLKNHNLGGLLEHLVQLVHLTAFGTIRQWAEMWEEYIYIRAHFEESRLSISEKENLKDACEQIEEYIFDLKKQQR